ncbi:MAG: hypothetical protein OXU20_17015 [Myxococcales bacterium]|nr:hypothetical protein [Myxococcales bacterium]MDD9968576.1 hypothetical protein [Myxococcales bacterium]
MHELVPKSCLGVSAVLSFVALGLGCSDPSIVASNCVDDGGCLRAEPLLSAEQLVARFCDIEERLACRRPSALDVAGTTCDRELASGIYDTGEACEPELMAALSCLVAAATEQNECPLRPGEATYSNGEDTSPCPSERSAYLRCFDEQKVETDGEAARCYPSTEGDGCFVYCNYDDTWVEPGPYDPPSPASNVVVGARRFTARCTGTAGGDKLCGCSLNGRKLIDLSHETTFYAESCEDAAQQMSDGQCLHAVDCCLTWPDGDGGQPCGCTDDPRRHGADSCEALAEDHGGQVVDLCPRYREILPLFPVAPGAPPSDGPPGF